MNELTDRSLENLRVDPKLLSEVVEIMSRNGRRTVVKIDDQRVDSVAAVSAADLSAAREVDVSSFWVNPDRPHFGRRHFVYFLAGPEGAKYFGDSISPEVQKVCEDLDVYFGRSMSGGTAGGHAWRPTGWVFANRDRLIAAAVLAGTLIAVVAFLLGRWSVDTTPVVVAPMPAAQSATPPDPQPVDPATPPTDLNPTTSVAPPAVTPPAVTPPAVAP